MQTVYEAAGGADGLLRLAHAWHARVMADEVVSHAFSHGFHPEHTERLAAYWAEALGGPTTYSAAYGDETSVVRMHSGNGPHEEMDRRAIACFDQALVDVGLAGDDRLRQVLHDYFAWATTTTMARYHAPPTTCPTVCRSRTGPGTDSSTAHEPRDCDGVRMHLHVVAELARMPAALVGHFFIRRASKKDDIGGLRRYPERTVSHDTFQEL